MGNREFHVAVQREGRIFRLDQYAHRDHRAQKDERRRGIQDWQLSSAARMAIPTRVPDSIRGTVLLLEFQTIVGISNLTGFRSSRPRGHNACLRTEMHCPLRIGFLGSAAVYPFLLALRSASRPASWLKAM